MNTDIRLSIGFWVHPKTRKLERLLGVDAIKSLQVLWLWAAQNRSDGVLSGMDLDDLELAGDWRGDIGVFGKALIDIGWVDDNGSAGYSLHDWIDHNPWVAEAKDRSNKSRFYRMAKTHPEIYERLSKEGVTGVTREEYERYTNVKKQWNESLATVHQTLTDVDPQFNQPLTTVDQPFNQPLTTAQALTPAPIPSPAPSPFPSPSPKGIIDTICSEPEIRSEQEAPIETAQPDAVLFFPTNRKDEAFPITEPYCSELKELFPAVDVDQELRNMKAWLMANPTKRKTKSGVKRFVVGWLSKRQNRGGAPIPNIRGRPFGKPAGQELQDALLESKRRFLENESI